MNPRRKGVKTTFSQSLIIAIYLRDATNGKRLRMKPSRGEKESKREKIRKGRKKKEDSNIRNLEFTMSIKSLFLFMLV